MSDFFSALGAIPTIMGLLNKKTTNPYGAQEKQMAGRLAQISAAQTDTSNPLYKQLYGQYQDQNRQTLAQTIAEMQGQNRMNTSMGRTPLLSPERGGETIFRNLMQGYQGMNNNADQQTRQALQGAAGTAGAAGTYYNAINKDQAMSNLSPLIGYQMLGNTANRYFGGQNDNSNSVSGNANNISGNANNDSIVDWIKRNQQPIISGGY